MLTRIHDQNLIFHQYYFLNALHLQLVDMRWGVPIDAADDHLASKICMEEIQNCQKLSIGPNFVVRFNSLLHNPEF